MSKMYDKELGLATRDDWNRMCMEEAERYRRGMLEGRINPDKANPEICEDMMNNWIAAVDLTN